MNQLEKSYNNVKHNLGFAGVNAIYNYFEKKVPRKQIEHFLTQWDSHTLLRESKNPKQFNPIYCYYPRQLICMDLFSFHKQAKSNNGYAYILSAIDGFTKKAWCVPLKLKNASTVLAAIKDLHQQVIGNFEKFVSDAGTEYYNKSLKQYFAQHGIDMWNPKRLGHSSFVERFQRTIEVKIAKYMVYAQTDKFVDVLSDLTEAYNNSYHRAINMTPNQAEASKKNHMLIREINEKKYSNVKARKPTFEKGQTVRILKDLGRFSRSYNKKFSEEIFKIQEIDLRFPIPLYTISNLDSTEVIIGKFMHYELTPVRMKQKVALHNGFDNNGRALVTLKGSDQVISLNADNY